MDLTAPIFTNEDAAREHFEALRWPDGRACPHCGVVGESALLKGKSTRPGLYKCKVKECRKPFTATLGTVFERSHIPLHKWLLATHLMVSSKKGMSAHQLFRMLGFGSYRTAWFMAVRIREAMRAGELAPFGQGGGAVEVDETYIGFDPDSQPAEGKKVRTPAKMKVVALVDRTTGRARSYVVDRVNVTTVAEILSDNVSREARLMSDQAGVYRTLGWNFAQHGVVDHSRDEYVSKLDRTVHTQTIEGYFSIFKRGMKGVYQHASKKHLHRYVAEFDFRYTNREGLGISDTERAAICVAATAGKRLTYRRAGGLTVH